MEQHPPQHPLASSCSTISSIPFIQFTTRDLLSVWSILLMVKSHPKTLPGVGCEQSIYVFWSVGTWKHCGHTSFNLCAYKGSLPSCHRVILGSPYRNSEDVCLFVLQNLLLETWQEGCKCCRDVCLSSSVWWGASTQMKFSLLNLETLPCFWIVLGGRVKFPVCFILCSLQEVHSILF